MSRRKSRRNSSQSRAKYYVVGGIALVAIVGYLLATTSVQGQRGTSSGSSSTTQSASTSETSASSKPIILYVNQGNGMVNGSNFGELLSTATSQGFNTIFFQVYRAGTLLFTSDSLTQFAASAHDQGLKIFFALYFTNSTQAIPTSIYSDGEDGISLDMSTLTIATQTALFGQLSSSYSGKTAITTTYPSLPVTPDLLVVETYAPSDQQYIHHGMIAGVEVVAASSKQDYEQQVQYALDNSDGVMVFDYAGLVKSGY
ncbi:MAG: hypothetical protein OK449_05675 [Thaumarchaeota archaeon]|nr:hypothetical protein [Nitrososphaerota archaeon]